MSITNEHYSSPGVMLISDVQCCSLVMLVRMSITNEHQSRMSITNEHHSILMQLLLLIILIFIYVHVLFIMIIITIDIAFHKHMQITKLLAKTHANHFKYVQQHFQIV